ncbi:MAG: phosphonate C-P lyase system protein PhnG [Pseudomonadota bacterium]
MTSPSVDAGGETRARVMSALALSQAGELKALWSQLDVDPECELIRGPETGLIALRGRMGGGGSAFNFSEATVTRATVRLGDGTVGHSIMLGRDEQKTKLAAVIDAMASSEKWGAQIMQRIIEPLEASQADRDAKLARETAATKVDFFTMVRGD